jgi:hypothetical protein
MNVCCIHLWRPVVSLGEYLTILWMWVAPAFCHAPFLPQIYFAFLPPGEGRTRVLVGRGTGSPAHPLRALPLY